MHLISIVLTQVPVVLHGKINHIEVCFDHLDLRNAMVSLMVLSTSHDADTNVNGITSQQWQWYHVILIAMVSHDKKVMLHFISNVLPKQCNGAIDDAVGIM